MTACSNRTDYPNQPETIAAPATQTYPGLAPIAPPPLQYEPPPLLENLRGSVWRPGYWSWNGSDYVWVSGEVMARPDPTAVWFPDHWAHHTYGWAFVAGNWE